MVSDGTRAASAAHDTDVVVRLRALRKSFSGHEVLRGIDLDLARQEVVCIIGPSGSGKSTLLSCINLLQVPTSGQVVVNGVELTAPKANLDAARRSVGMVFQHFNLFPHRTILQNVTMPLRTVLKLPKAEAEQRALAQLDQLHVAQLRNMRPSDCSGGQQQRVAIARALVMQPKVMLFDEATSALDPELVKGVLDVMRELAASGMTMAVVTHELGFAREVADRIVFIDEGRIAEQGRSEELLSRPTTPRLRDFLSKVL